MLYNPFVEEKFGQVYLISLVHLDKYIYFLINSVFKTTVFQEKEEIKMVFLRTLYFTLWTAPPSSSHSPK